MSNKSLRIIQSTLAAAIGVQNKKNRERDFRRQCRHVYRRRHHFYRPIYCDGNDGGTASNRLGR